MNPIHPTRITAVAIDDEPPALRIVESFCARVGFIDLKKTFNKPREAFLYLANNPADLLFLDIHMPSTSGIDFYKGLKTETMVIFTTAFSEYAVEGFNLSAIDYLLKPYTFERFQQAANKARDYFTYLQGAEKSAEPALYIRADYSLIRILLQEILYIEAYDDYLKIHIQDQKTVVARMTLKNIQEQLPADQFFRVHRSYIIPRGRIRKIGTKTLELAGIEIPLGGSYKDDLMNWFGKT